MPSPENTRLNKYATNIGVGYPLRDGWVAEYLAPIHLVDNRSDAFTVGGFEAWNIVDDTADLLSSVREVDFELSDSTFTCKGHALRARTSRIDDSAPGLDLLAGKTRLVSKHLMMAREKAVIDSLVVNNTSLSTGSATTAWATSGATIITEVNGWCHDIRNACGAFPTAMIMGADVHRALINAGDMKDRMKSGMAVPTLDMMRGLFAPSARPLDIYISTAVYNTAHEGQTKSVSAMWPAKKILLLVQPDLNPDPETGRIITLGEDPGFARMLYWRKATGGRNGIAFRTWFSEDIGTHGGNFVQGQHYYVPQMMTSASAVLYTVLA